MLLFNSGEEFVTKEKYFKQIDAGTIKSHVPASRSMCVESPIGTVKSRGGEPGLTREMNFPTHTIDAQGFEPFQPIGIGKPLTIMIREVYTGKYPEKLHILGKQIGDADMLVTTAIKSSRIFNAQPLAINIHKKKVSHRDRINRPAASATGTQYVYYSPAMAEKSLTLDIQMIFDDFPKESFEAVGSALQTASTIPIFLPVTGASTYLLAVGALTKLTGKIGEKIFDSKPEFSVTEPLDIKTPGGRPVPEGYALITDQKNINTIDKDFLKKCEFCNDGKVRYKSNGELYDGNVPYIVISLDGSLDPALNDFEPTALTAALISQFFDADEGIKTQTEIVLEGMKLYNDLQYRREIDTLNNKIKTASSADKPSLVERRDALEKNITNPLFKQASAS